MLKDVIIFIISLFFLIKGSDKFTEYLKIIGIKLRVKDFVISLILASIATTLPEIIVSIISSLKGNSNLALGNALGSVIVNTALILGICSLISPMKVDDLAWKNSFFLLFINFLLFLLMFDMKISRFEGFILLILYAIFIYIIYRVKGDNKSENYQDQNSAIKIFILMILSIGVVIVSSRFLVESSINIARFLNISELIIGLTLVALGTSLPELANSVISTIKKVPDIGVGNIIGASILNVLVVIGIASIINPIKVDQKFITYIMPVILITLLALSISLKRDNIIGKKTGLILLSLYFISIILNFIF
uniref:Calcium/sodium antiporter n=1 Tax=Dictyoglomus thermophilum TaxID=14 RepID=A0A7C3MIE0_DICTH